MGPMVKPWETVLGGDSGKTSPPGSQIFTCLARLLKLRGVISMIAKQYP